MARCRLGSRLPGTRHFRVTDALCAMLERHHPLWLNAHFNHPKELTPEAAEACDKLTRAGIPLGNQSVLLRGVNDDVETMRTLLHKLLQCRVRPYYLYQMDLILGSSHLGASVARGIEIMEGLRGHTSGYAIPQYVIDAPGGGGKVPVGPENGVRGNEDRVVIRNYEGQVFEYPEPKTPKNMAMEPAALLAECDGSH